MVVTLTIARISTGQVGTRSSRRSSSSTSSRTSSSTSSSSSRHLGFMAGAMPLDLRLMALEVRL